MAPRIKLRHLPYDRTKIKVGVLLEMLEAHATGRRKMDASQVRAAETPGCRFGAGKTHRQRARSHRPVRSSSTTTRSNS